MMCFKTRFIFLWEILFKEDLLLKELKNFLNETIVIIIYNCYPRFISMYV